MKQTAMIAIALLFGIGIGAGAIEGLKAQGNAKPAYLIAEVEVTDQDAYRQYAQQVPATLAPYNAQFLVRGGKADAKEGAPPAGRVVVIRFDSLADAEKWHDNPPYSEIAPIRQRAAKSRVFIVEGEPR